MQTEVKKRPQLSVSKSGRERAEDGGPTVVYFRDEEKVLVRDKSLKGSLPQSVKQTIVLNSVVPQQKGSGLDSALHLVRSAVN